MAEPMQLGETTWRCPVCNKVTEPYTEDGDTYSYCKEHKPKKAGWFSKEKKELPCKKCEEMESYHLHKPSEQCEGCKAPQDHHQYEPADRRKPEKATVGTMSFGDSVIKVATNFILSKKQEFQPGDKVKVIEPRYQPLGIYEKTGEVTESLGRGWYMVKLDDARLYRFFSGEGWSDIELLQSQPEEMPAPPEQTAPEPEAETPAPEPAESEIPEQPTEPLAPPEETEQVQP